MAGPAVWRVLQRQLSSSTVRPGTAFRTGDRVHAPSDLDVLERVASARGCCRSFQSDAPVPDKLLRRILAITQRTPSGFNMQPYHVIIVDALSSRQRLADAMLGGNGDRVLSAPLSAVFVADGEPLDHGRLEQVLHSERSAGRPSTYLRNMPFDASVFIGRRETSDPLAAIARQGLLGLGSLLMPLPAPGVSTAAWAYKQAGLAAMSYMLAATAAGLGTYPMEGVEQVRARAVLGLPAHFSVPLVISTGYEAGSGPQASAEGGHDAHAEAGQEEALPVPTHERPSTVIRSPRLSPEYLFRHNTFHTPYVGVEPL